MPYHRTDVDYNGMSARKYRRRREKEVLLLLALGVSVTAVSGAFRLGTWLVGFLFTAWESAGMYSCIV